MIFQIVEIVTRIYNGAKYGKCYVNGSLVTVSLCVCECVKEWVKLILALVVLFKRKQIFFQCCLRLKWSKYHKHSILAKLLFFTKIKSTGKSLIHLVHFLINSVRICDGMMTEFCEQ